jgi:uncharacterized membrane protein
MNTRVVSPSGTRPATPQQLTWLGTQLDAWCEEGLLDREQAAAIRGRYHASRRVSVGRLLLALGGTFVGIGLIWLVAANLDELPPLGRFVAVAAIWLALLVAGEWLAARHRSGLGSRALVESVRLVAALAFGATIFQAAQSLQVPAYEPKLVGLWAAGALLHGYVAGSIGPLLVGQLAGSVWFIWQVVHDEPSGLSAVLALLVLAGLGLGLAAVHSRLRPEFESSYRELGALFGLAGLFAAALPFLTTRDFGWSLWAVVGVAAAVLAVAAGAWLGRGDVRFEPLAVSAVALVAVGLVLWDTGAETTGLDVSDWLHALTSVGVYVVVAVGVAVLGTLRDSWQLTALATVAIVVFTTFQSFAVFAEIIQGAWLFVLLGLVFLGTGFLFDRARRELAAALEGESS